MTYKLIDNGVLRQSDNASIPNDPANIDWRDYQTWLIAGNTPDPADVVDPWQIIRIRRDQLLRQSDWTHISDVPMTEVKRAEWAIYRQSLRDITKDFLNPGDVIWPTEPKPVEG